MTRLRAVVREVLAFFGVNPSERRAADTINVQRAEHQEALAEVRRTKEHAINIRAEANEVISEARRAEQILERRPPNQ